MNNIAGEQSQHDVVSKEASQPEFAYQQIRANDTNPVGPTSE